MIREKKKVIRLILRSTLYFVHHVGVTLKLGTDFLTKFLLYHECNRGLVLVSLQIGQHKLHPSIDLDRFSTTNELLRE